MGNPNANSLEASATTTATPAAEPTKGEVTCSDSHCRCHDTQSVGHCGDCGILPTVSVTLGLALADHTWVERKVEFPIDPEFEENESFDLVQTSFEHWITQNEDEANKLAPSGWFLIAWEWKA